MKYLIPVLAGLFLTACTSAGPFVTNISRTKSGDLIVEKCMMEHNGWLMAVSNKDCTTQTM